MKYLSVLCLLLATAVAQDGDFNLGSLFGGNQDGDWRQGDAESCQAKCKSEKCDNVGIRYGRYCGVGHGCSNREYKPCDPIDECCMHHDECVTNSKKAMMDNKCHSDLVDCLSKHEGNANEIAFKKGRSKKCKPLMAIETMKQGMGLSMLFGGLFGGGGGMFGDEGGDSPNVKIGDGGSSHGRRRKKAKKAKKPNPDEDLGEELPAHHDALL